MHGVFTQDSGEFIFCMWNIFNKINHFSIQSSPDPLSNYNEVKLFQISDQ